jgi:hypothetical protein
MNEVWARLLLVAGLLAIAGAIALIQRKRPASASRTVPARGLAAGAYFFSSTTCSSCDRARDKLNSRFGEDGYIEFSWERDPEAFDTHRIGQVPALLIISEGGRGRLHLGQPDKALDP